MIALLILVFPASALADPINAVVGDESWFALYGRAPVGVDEVSRIRVHLAWVETRLRGSEPTHLSAEQRERRELALDALAEYRRRGVFPRRTDDAYVGRRPRFIDDRGVRCAVGELIAATGHPELAARIRDAHEYAYVPDIDDPELLAWAETHGLSVRELAMIQPGYSPPPTADAVRAEIESSKDGITLECAREHAPPSSFRLRIRGDSRGEVHVHARSDDPFVRCFVSKLGDLGSGGAWDEQPRRFRLRMRVDVTPPQEQLDRLLRTLRVEETVTSCIPRPGPMPNRAFFNVRVGERGVLVGARTEPHNAEVERCLRIWLRNALQRFGPGRLRLHGRAPDLELGRVMSTSRLEQALQSYAPHTATECFEHGAPERASVRVRAEVDRPLAIEIEGGEDAWRECLAAKLDEQLRSNFSVSRQLSDGTYERFFRVDASAEAEHSFEIEGPEEREQRQREERERMEREMERYSL